MPQRPEPSLTVLLRRSRAGEAGAEDELFQVVFDDLREIARGLMQQERRGHTLQPTALVGEAWLRLSDPELGWEDRAHFFSVAARAMRRSLVDHARSRGARKRRSDAVERVPLDDVVAAFETQPYDLLDLDVALEDLACVDAQLAQIVELRFFAGLTLEETGQTVGMTFQQVHRAWNLARGWLHRRLRGRPREQA